MSVNRERPKICKIEGCNKSTCSPHTDLCHKHWKEAWAEREDQLRAEEARTARQVSQ